MPACRPCEEIDQGATQPEQCSIALRRVVPAHLHVVVREGERRLPQPLVRCGRSLLGDPEQAQVPPTQVSEDGEAVRVSRTWTVACNQAPGTPSIIDEVLAVPA